MKTTWRHSSNILSGRSPQGSHFRRPGYRHHFKTVIGGHTNAGDYFLNNPHLRAIDIQSSVGCRRPESNPVRAGFRVDNRGAAWAETKSTFPGNAPGLRRLENSGWPCGTSRVFQRFGDKTPLPLWNGDTDWIHRQLSCVTPEIAPCR